MTDWYHEPLSPQDAKLLLGDGYSDYFSYTLITSLDKLVINKRDKRTGEETEILIDDNVINKDILDVPKITYTPEEKRFALNWHGLMLTIIIVSIAISCMILRTIL